MGLIVGLFWLDRQPRKRTSWALWIPIAWLWVVCSRTVSAWLGQVSLTVSAQEVLDGSPADRAFFLILLAAALPVLVTRGKRVLALISANAAVVAFIGFCTLSLFWSEFPQTAFKRWIKVIGDFSMVLIVLTEVDPVSAVERVLARLGFTLIPLSVLFTKYYPHLGMAYNEWMGTPMYLGVTLNKNTLGAISMIFGMGALWRIVVYLKDPGREGRWRHIAASGILLLMILRLFYLLDSKTSLSSFVMAGSLLLFSSVNLTRRIPWLVHLMAASMVSVAAAIVFIGVSPELLKAIGRNPTLTERTILWNQLFSFVQNPILGTGFESFWLGDRLERIWKLNPWAPNQAHNGYIEIFLNLGWMGIALLTLVILVGYMKVFRSWRVGSMTGNLSLAFFFIAIVFNFTEAGFFRIQAAVSIFFLLAIMNPVITAAPQMTTEAVARVRERWFGQTDQHDRERTPFDGYWGQA